MTPPPTFDNTFARHWQLESETCFLNHGSFGACPTHVLEYQDELRARLEREPVRFFVEEFEGLLDEARATVGAYLGANPDDLAFVPNATVGVNSVLRSLRFEPGDELLTTNHEYNACRNVLKYIAERDGATIVVVEVPFPLESPKQVHDAVLARVTERTKLAMISHVTSPTALIFPIESIVASLNERGIDMLVDAAHAPGMIDVNIDAIGAAYYTGNCHKWMCAPKGAGFVWVRRDRQPGIRPAVISHGANSQRTDRSRFRLEFDWTGTDDPTPMLCVGEALRHMASLVPGGWSEIRQRNHEKILAARTLLCERLDVPVPAPDAMIGSMASIPLPDTSGPPAVSALYADPLQLELRTERGIQVPIVPWPAHPRRLVRLSAQLYNAPSQYEHLAEALRELLGP